LQPAAVAPIVAQNAQAALPAALQQMQSQTRIDGATATVPPAPAAPKLLAAPAAGLAFTLSAPPAAQLTNGATFQVPILIRNAVDITSVPLQLHYDAAKLALANVAGGDLLSRDGQAVALIHRDDGPGNLTVVASRPPGTNGVSGAGTLCVLTFQAKTVGATSIELTRAGAMNSAELPVPAATTQLNLEIK